MKILRKQNAPRYSRQEGIISYLLASPRTCDAKHLIITLVEITPGGHQRVHRHDPEQIYYIIEGVGLMAVGDESEPVSPGDCIFIPSGKSHGLKNTGSISLKYLSATSPSFSREELDSFWPLDSTSGTKA